MMTPTPKDKQINPIKSTKYLRLADLCRTKRKKNPDRVFDVTEATLWKWVRKGLLPTPERDENGQNPFWMSYEVATAIHRSGGDASMRHRSGEVVLVERPQLVGGEA
jgi:hypothetical protein